MASCDWKKIKTPQEAKALLRHCITDERLKTQHSNKQIDKTRTHLNLHFGTMGDYKMSAYWYDKRIAELDKQQGANKRKDRVTLVGLDIPLPDGLPAHFAEQWFRSVYAKLGQRFGDENVVGGVVHFDEVHSYVDAETGEKRQSRPHLHAYVVPVIDGKLNAKSVMCRGNMVALNNEIEDITRAYGCRFLTGTHRKSTKSVEQLKNESQLVATQQEAQRIIEDAQRRSETFLSNARHQAQLIIEKARETADANEKESALALARIRALHAASVRLRNEYETRSNAVRQNKSLEVYCKNVVFSDGKSVYQKFVEKLEEEKRALVECDRNLAEFNRIADEYQKSKADDGFTLY